MLISIITGIAAGSIHVIGGADHLAAMVPSAFRHPKFALREGLAWGIGHSTGVLILSVVGILIKDWVDIHKMSTLAEYLVGIALLVVGVYTIKNAFGLNIHTHKHNHVNGVAHDHIHLHFRGRQKHFRHHHTSTSLGVLHGMAGASHFLAVMPALALPMADAFAYMAAYLSGSIATMIIFLFAVSFATSRVGRRFLPMIFGAAGALSFVTGVFWLQRI